MRRGVDGTEALRDLPRMNAYLQVKAKPATKPPFGEDDEEDLPGDEAASEMPPEEETSGEEIPEDEEFPEEDPAADATIQEGEAPEADPGQDDDALLAEASMSDDDPDAPTDEQNPQQQAADDGEQAAVGWAGEIDESGEETDPGSAFGALTAPDGTEAWLDVAADHSLIGWVREADGTVRRYTDPDLWADDVDAAGMQLEHGPDGSAPEGAPEGATGEGEPGMLDDIASKSLPQIPARFIAVRPARQLVALKP